MGQGPVPDRTKEQERRSSQSPTYGPGNTVQNRVLPPAQTVAKTAAWVVQVWKPGGYNGRRVGIQRRLCPGEQRGYRQGRDPEYSVCCGIQREAQFSNPRTPPGTKRSRE